MVDPAEAVVAVPEVLAEGLHLLLPSSTLSLPLESFPARLLLLQADQAMARALVEQLAEQEEVPFLAVFLRPFHPPIPGLVGQARTQLRHLYQHCRPVLEATVLQQAVHWLDQRHQH